MERKAGSGTEGPGAVRKNPVKHSLERNAAGRDGRQPARTVYDELGTAEGADGVRRACRIKPDDAPDVGERGHGGRAGRVEPHPEAGRAGRLRLGAVEERRDGPAAESAVALAALERPTEVGDLAALAGVET